MATSSNGTERVRGGRTNFLTELTGATEHSGIISLCCVHATGFVYVHLKLFKHAGQMSPIRCFPPSDVHLSRLSTCALSLT